MSTPTKHSNYILCYACNLQNSNLHWKSITLWWRMIFVEEGRSLTIFFNQDLVISSNLYCVDIWWWALELRKLLTTIELHAFHEEPRMFSITLTKWQQQQVLQMALQLNLNSLDSIAIFLQAFTNPTYKWKNFKE